MPPASRLHFCRLQMDECSVLCGNGMSNEKTNSFVLLLNRLSVVQCKENLFSNWLGAKDMSHILG